MKQANGKLTVSDRVYNQLLIQISNGTFSNGEKLPSEQELCRQFNVSRISVRSALQRLEAIGLIETLHGKGSYVKEGSLDVNDTLQEISEISSMQMLSDKNLDEFWKFRYAIEMQAFTLFSVVATETDFNNLNEIVCRMIDTSTAEELVQVSLEYHCYIYNHCQNRYIANTMNLYKNVLEASIRTLQTQRHQSRSTVVQWHNAYTTYLQKKDIESIMSIIIEENVLHIKNSTTLK